MSELEKMCQMVFDEGEVISYNRCMTYDLKKIETYLILLDGEYYSLNKFNNVWNNFHHEIIK